MHIKYIKIIVLVVIIATFMFGAFSLCPVSASEIVPDGGRKEYGNYTVNDFVLTAVNIATWILGIVGSLALLMFIYGGFMFILSGGNAEKTAQGKQIIINAVIGLVIIFTSYTIIQFSMTALLGEKEAAQYKGKLFQTSWFKGKAN